MRPSIARVIDRRWSPVRYRWLNQVYGIGYSNGGQLLIRVVLETQLLSGRARQRDDAGIRQPARGARPGRRRHPDILDRYAQVKTRRSSVATLLKSNTPLGTFGLCRDDYARKPAHGTYRTQIRLQDPPTP